MCTPHLRGTIRNNRSGAQTQVAGKGPAFQEEMRREQASERAPAQKPQQPGNELVTPNKTQILPDTYSIRRLRTSHRKFSSRARMKQTGSFAAGVSSPSSQIRRPSLSCCLFDSHGPAFGQRNQAPVQERPNFGTSICRPPARSRGSASQAGRALTRRSNRVFTVVDYPAGSIQSLCHPATGTFFEKRILQLVVTESIGFGIREAQKARNGTS